MININFKTFHLYYYQNHIKKLTNHNCIHFVNVVVSKACNVVKMTALTSIPLFKEKHKEIIKY